jgi:hypothetical protein
MGDSFWNSRAGHVIRWRQRWLHTRILQIEGEPEQKAGRGGRFRVAQIQRDLVGQLRKRDQYQLTGPVALAVTFCVSQPQSPGLHKLAKHLLDLLGPVRPEDADRGRRHVLYRDDRQVKLHTCIFGAGSAASGRSPIKPSEGVEKPNLRLDKKNHRPRAAPLITGVGDTPTQVEIKVEPVHVDHVSQMTVKRAR